MISGSSTGLRRPPKLLEKTMLQRHSRDMTIKCCEWNVLKFYSEIRVRTDAYSAVGARQRSYGYKYARLPDVATPLLDFTAASTCPSRTILCNGTVICGNSSYRLQVIFRWIFTYFGHPFAPKILESGFSFNFLRDPCQGKCKRYRVTSMKTGSKCYRPEFHQHNSACTEIYFKKKLYTIHTVETMRVSKGIC